MLITQLGYNKIIQLDSIRTVRVFLKLIQLADGEGKIQIKQTELARILGLRNKANINVSIAELIEKDYIRKSFKGRNITYFINPTIAVTQLGYTELQKIYGTINVNLDDLIDELMEEAK